MVYPLYLIILALAPSTVWLLFFLQKDAHPEPKRMILKIFFYGMLSAVPAALIEAGFQFLIPKNLFFEKDFQYYLAIFLYFIIGVALVEEVFKYLVVRVRVMQKSAMDEPLDVMLYMIIAALGFAALENIFIFLSKETFFSPLNETIALASYRFISATFLHALCSGTLGFFLAMSFCETRKRGIFLTVGFTLAVFLHGLYNFSIMEIEGYLKFGIPLIILISLAIFVSWGFQKLKSLKSICKI